MFVFMIYKKWSDLPADVDNLLLQIREKQFYQVMLLNPL